MNMSPPHTLPPGAVCGGGVQNGLKHTGCERHFGLRGFGQTLHV